MCTALSLSPSFQLARLLSLVLPAPFSNASPPSLPLPPRTLPPTHRCPVYNNNQSKAWRQARGLQAARGPGRPAGWTSSTPRRYVKGVWAGAVHEEQGVGAAGVGARCCPMHVLAFLPPSFRLVHVSVDTIPILYSFLYPWYGHCCLSRGKAIHSFLPFLPSLPPPSPRSDPSKPC